jgi:predicted glycosyltransferase
MHGSVDGLAPAGGRGQPRRLRVALYSHDAQGRGNLWRNLAVARALAESELAPDLLMVSGTPDARAVELPARADWLTLPSLHRSADGVGSGRWDPEAIVRVRAAAIAGALESFDPDLLIVDELPRGAFDELQPALDRRRRSGGRTVLGLRDVLDAPTTAEWQQARATEAIAEHYDEVWVYGDPRVSDPVAEYGLPPVVRAKAHYTGYLAPPAPRPLRPGWPLAVCLVTGSQDGYALARTFLEAGLPPATMGLLVTGPHMPAVQRDHLERIAAQRGDRQVRQLAPGALEVLVQAHAAVSMGDYSTLCEILASGVPAFIVPSAAPRQEERIRAERLKALDVVDTCAPETLTSARLSSWIAQAVRDGRRTGTVPDTGGLAVVSQLAARLCGRPGSDAGVRLITESGAPIKAVI